MPRCAPCLEASLKERLLNSLTDAALREAVNALPACGVRKRSKYQEFTASCLRAKHLTKFDPTALKDCARQWREQKGGR